MDQLIVFSRGAADAVNVPGVQGFTPLHMACLGGHVPIIEMLLSAGADVNMHTKKPTGHNETPLYTACRCGHVGVVRVLLRHGASADVQQQYLSPLQCAAQYGR